VSTATADETRSGTRAFENTQDRIKNHPKMLTPNSKSWQQRAEGNHDSSQSQWSKFARQFFLK
jgi:hypothetical protein